MADHLRDATKKVDFILRNDAVQCAKDLSVDLLNDGLDSASYGAQAVAEWLKDIPAADVVEKTEWDKLMFLVDAANQILKSAKWISVKERLPEKGIYVLCACRANILCVMKWDGIDWFENPTHVYMSGFVTHWMPLPEPPKEGGGEDG